MSLKDSEEKLSKLATLAEELSAELYLPDNKVVAEKFKKISSYARKIATCIRLHDAIPVESENKIKQAIKTIDNAFKTIKSTEDFLRSKS